MITISSLWLAILLAAALSWIMSAIVWMVMPHHKTDFAKFPDEDAVRAAMGPQNIPPGQYNIPHMTDWDECKTDEGKAKFDDGPVGYMTVVPSRLPAMGGMMVQQFVFFLAVSFVVAYVCSRTLAPGTEYLKVFQVAGTVAWLAYGFGTIPEGIWFGRPWPNVLKTLFDAFLYALLTAGVFGWLWPA